jgi:general secretion pathway protein D
MVAVNKPGMFIFVMVLSLPAYADRGNSAYKRGVSAERQGHFDAAYEDYKQADALTPNNPKYFIAYTRMRAKAADEHVHNGQLLRNTGALQDALHEFQRAAEIDRTNFAAQQELHLTAEIMRRQEKQRVVPKVESELDKWAAQVAKPVELQPISTAPIMFHMVANSDLVYRAICKIAGINVVFDPDYKPQKINVELNDVTLYEALEMLRLQSKTYWQPLSANTIFVTTDSPTKRKDLEQNVMKTFYLQNLSSSSELQEVAGLISKMLDLNRVQVLQEQDALVVRGTMDQMVLVEKVLNEIDKAKPEVVIDVAVMEVYRQRIRDLGMAVPTSEGIGYIPPGTGINSSSGSVTIGNWSFTVPSTTFFTAMASDSNTKVLQNPRIRVLNDEKATLKIGNRVPVASGSFAPGLVSGSAVSPLISTQFQYLDIGVNIDITPHVHSTNDVTLKMVMEVSSLNGESNLGGITEPIISQRRIEHTARVADGDVNLLGGILEDTETKSLAGYPWVTQLPILKYLFGQDNKERDEDEIVFAITPHIVRALEVTEADLRVLPVGTGSETELHRKPSAAATPAHPEPQPSSAPGSSAGKVGVPDNIAVKTNPPQAVVIADGAALAGKTPLSFHLSPGRHELIIFAAGYQLVRREIDIPETGMLTIATALSMQQKTRTFPLP